MAEADLLAQARAGDDAAFERLIGPYRRELHVHCSRILGSAQDTEDALQEALLSAWQSLSDFEERASLRTWLYRIATNRCLNVLRSAGRRPQVDGPLFELPIPAPTRHGEVFWLEPYPDALFDEIADDAPSPEARYDLQEATSLAFVTALQLLPPRQRAVLLLRDVLGFRGREVAEMLGSSEESVASALKRARQSIRDELPAPTERPPGLSASDERELLERFTSAFESHNVDALVQLLTEDAWLRMPPVPLEYQGRDLAHGFFSVVFRQDREYRLVPTRANGQPAFGVYVSDPVTSVLHAMGLLVVTISGNKLGAITRFDNTVLSRFGLPRSL